MKSQTLSLTQTPDRKDVLVMKGNFVEYKVTEYPEQTVRGLEWVVIFKRVYL